MAAPFLTPQGRRRHRPITRQLAVRLSALATAAAMTWALIALPGWADETSQPQRERSTGAVPPVACADGYDAGRNGGTASGGAKGDDEGWFQVVYVHRDGQDRFDDSVGRIRRTMWDVDQIFEASARRFGHHDSRRLRFEQDAHCQIDVKSVGLAGLPDNPGLGSLLGPATEQLDAQLGLVRGTDRFDAWHTHHKIIWFMDVDGVDGCGLGGGGTGLSAGNAWVSWGCAGDAAVSHEMIHSFNISHCSDDHSQGNDPICRGFDATPRCDDVMSGVVLDCAKDEFAYFQPEPAPGSRLAEHPEENVWNSPYLITDQPAPAVTARLRNPQSGLCLQAGPHGSVVQHPCVSGEKSQVWRRTIDRDGYLTLALAGRCLTMPSRTVYGDGETVPVTAATLEDCRGGDDRQQWWMEDGHGPAGDSYEFVGRATKQRLAIEGGSKDDGARLVQPGGGDAAAFKMEFTGASTRHVASGFRVPTQPVRLVSQDATQCLAAPGGGRAGAVPVPVVCAASSAQRASARALAWRLTPVRSRGGAGTVTVQIRTGGRVPVCMTSTTAEPGRAAGIRLAGCDSADPGQLWTATGHGSRVRLGNESTGLYLGLATRAGRTLVAQRPASAAQEFVLRRG